VVREVQAWSAGDDRALIKHVSHRDGSGESENGGEGGAEGEHGLQSVSTDIR
jgi:hypothetical protein